MVASSGSVLAFDLGGTSLRAALVGADGAVGARARVEQRIEKEVEAEAWWRALEDAAGRVAREDGAGFAGVRAICITGITRTQVVLDRNGLPLRKALTFADTRAAEVVAALPALEHAEAAQLNAYHPAARLLWIARHEPEVLAGAAAVVDPKDYLAARLTGRVCTDPISAARLLAAGEPRGASLLDRLGLKPLVPELLPPGGVIGRVRADVGGVFAGLAGREVIMASHDSWAGVVGLGALEDGGAYNLSGTTEVLGVLSGKAGAAEGLLAVDWGGGLRHLGGPSNAGAGSVAWVAGLLAPGEAVGSALDRLLALPRQAQPALFLPYLEGERTPYWDAELRGGFLGLSALHGAADLVWAALEGVACLNRLVLERAEAVSGPVRAIRFGGGGAGSAVWAQVKADMLGRPVVTTRETEAGLLGAGITAWTALGLARSLQDGQNAMVQIARTFDPAPERRAFYDRLYAAYREAEREVAPVSRMLARMG